MATKKAASKSKATKTRVVISGRGISFSVLDIDQETFVLFTRTGIDAEVFEDLKSQLTEAGDYITAPLLGETTVTIDGRKYRGTWNNIKAQCGGVLPPSLKIYDVPAGSYSVILEVTHKGDFVNAEVADFDPAKLSFDIEHVQLSKGREYVLLDPYYKLESLDFGTTKAMGEIYVVDGKGKRYEVKRLAA